MEFDLLENGKFATLYETYMRNLSVCIYPSYMIKPATAKSFYCLVVSQPSGLLLIACF